MRPRPRSRLKPLQVIPARDLAEAVEALQHERQAPVAILSGFREWVVLKRDPEARHWLAGWPGDGDTFCGVPVIVKPGLGSPRIMRTMGELEDVLLEGRI